MSKRLNIDDDKRFFELSKAWRNSPVTGSGAAYHNLVAFVNQELNRVAEEREVKNFDRMKEALREVLRGV